MKRPFLRKARRGSDIPLMQFRMFSNLARTALTLAALLAGAITCAADDAQECRGIDILAETRAKEPELYRSIMEKAGATVNADALLWKIERDGTPPSYLFGTVHLTDERVTTLSPAVERALQDSKTIALEVSDLTQQATAAVLAKSGPLVMYTDGRRLDHQLSSTEYEAVKGIITRSGMPADLAAQFKPWIVTMIMSVSDCERTKVQQGARVLDMKIAEIGKSRGLEVIGL
jgi:uncharacterized protein